MTLEAQATAAASERGEIWITRRFRFSASHRFWVAAWDEATNEAAFGGNVRPHGHNYVLDVSITGTIDPTTGMIVNLSEIKRVVGALIDERYDHRDLSSEHPSHRELPATTERVATVLAAEIAERLPAGVRLAHLRLWETEDLFAEVIP